MIMTMMNDDDDDDDSFVRSFVDCCFVVVDLSTECVLFDVVRILGQNSQRDFRLVKCLPLTKVDFLL
jgi:hypothetical protein